MNTNIALNARGIRLPQQNALAPYQQANAMLQLKANKQQMAQAEQAAQARNAMLADLQGAADNNQRVETLMRHGDFDNAMKLQEHGSKMSKAERDAIGQKYELAGQIVSGVTDQESFNSVIPDLEKVMGSPLTEAERIYNPENIRMITNMAIKAKDAREFENKDRDYKLSADRFSETQRHNRAMEVKDTGPNIYIDGNEHAKLDAKYYSEMYNNLQGKGRASNKLLGQYRLIHGLIGDAYSGAGGNQVQSVKKLGQLAGIDLGNVSGPEAAAVVSNKLALELRSPEGGAGMPGAMSDRDREFLLQMVPGLTTSKEGRDLMIKVQERIAKRDQQIADEARKYRMDNRYLDIGFEQMIEAKYGSQDIFSDLYGKVPDVGDPTQAAAPTVVDMSDDDLRRELGLGQ